VASVSTASLLYVFEYFQHEVDICRKEQPYVIPTKCSDSYGANLDSQIMSPMTDAALTSGGSVSDVIVDSQPAQNITGTYKSSLSV